MLSLVRISISLSLIFLSLQSFAAKKTINRAQVQNYKKFSSTPITLVGEYKKHDKQFVFLKVKGAPALVRVNRKYLLNSPSFLSDGEKVSVNLPIGRHLTDNKELLMKKRM